MALKEVLALLKVKVDTKEVKEGKKDTDSMTKSIKALSGAIAASGIVLGIRSFTISMIGMGDELDKTSQQLGLSIRELQELRHAAGLAGVDATAMSQSLAQLQQRASQAAQGSSSAAALFRRLGVNVKDASGEVKNANVLIRDVANGMQGMGNSTERVAIAQELMGRTGRRLLPLLTGGAEAINASTGELNQLGSASEEFVNLSVEVTDNLARWNHVITVMKTQFATAMLPTINRTVQAFTKLGAKIAAATKQTELAKPLFIGLGAVAVAAAIKAAIAWGVALAPLLLFGATVVIVVGALQDLWVGLKGGRSLIVDFAGAIVELITGGDMTMQTYAANFAGAIDYMIQKIEQFVNKIADIGIGGALFRGIGDLFGEDDEAGFQLTDFGRAQRQEASGLEALVQSPMRQDIVNLRTQFLARQGGGAGASTFARRTPPAVTVNNNIEQPITVNEAVNARETTALVRREIDRTEQIRNSQTVAALTDTGAVSAED